MIKKFFVFLTLLIILFSVYNLAYSENTLEELELENKVINFMQNHIDNFSVSECVKLYDFNDELNAYLYIGEKSGYAIISKLTNEIVEFSLSQDSPISIMDSKKIKFYYNGPLAFYKQVNDKIKDLKTGEVFDKRNLTELNVLKYEDKNVVQTDSILLNTFTIKIPAAVPNYSYNPNGICGSTAAAMFLRYYDIYVNGSYVPLSLQSLDGILLINHLIPYIDGSNPGSLPGQVVSGLTTYLTMQGVNSTVRLEISNPSWIFSCVSNNKPYILGLYNHPTYNNHWVTGYGYSNTGTSYFAIVNDGHGNSEIYINTNYTDFIIYQ